MKTLHVSQHKLTAIRFVGCFFAVCDQNGKTEAVTKDIDMAILIAAAPDLLAALELADTILAGMGPLYPQGEGAETIRAAIAKARGES